MSKTRSKVSLKQKQKKEETLGKVLSVVLVSIGLVLSYQTHRDMFVGQTVFINKYPEKTVVLEKSEEAGLPSKLKEVIKGTPMEKMEKSLVEANKKYPDVSPYLIVGIAKAESSFCKNYTYDIDRKNHNCWGIKPKGGRRDDGSYLKWYKSQEEGVMDVARLLNDVYIKNGRETEEEIMDLYVGPVNYQWVETVKSVTKLEKEV